MCIYPKKGRLAISIDINVAMMQAIQYSSCYIKRKEETK